jgi:hypothetical protein
MTTSPTEALARAASALVRDHDLTGVLADLLADAQSALSAAAVGLLVETEPGHLELLTASSHATTQLELFQIQERRGPCVDALTSGSPVWESGTDRLESRWAEVGQAITAAGHVAVHAYPLRWRDHGIGALNVFFGQPPADTPALRLLGQAFADMATLVVLHEEDLSARDIVDRTERALAGRTIVEQAKGVIAYLDDVPVEDAYLVLRQRAERESVTLTVMAQRVLDEAARSQG